MTREQDQAIERLALQHGRAAAKGGYSDGAIRANVPNGQQYRVLEGGQLVPDGVYFGINWEAS